MFLLLLSYLYYFSTFYFFFFFNDTATTEIYTLSLHDALPISQPGGFRLPRAFHVRQHQRSAERPQYRPGFGKPGARQTPDRKSTRLNSSHGYISYAVFCLKKKKKKNNYYIFLTVVKVNTSIRE